MCEVTGGEVASFSLLQGTHQSEKSSRQILRSSGGKEGDIQYFNQAFNLNILRVKEDRDKKFWDRKQGYQGTGRMFKSEVESKI